MKRKYFHVVLQLAAFLIPVYFIFYPPLNENPKDPFIKSLWWFIAAGFCFYGILAAIIFVI